MKKISFNATERANSAIDELISSGFFTSKTDVLNTAILDLHRSLIEPGTVIVSAETRQPTSNHAVSKCDTDLKVQIVRDCNEPQNNATNNYLWEILHRILTGDYSPPTAQR